jgi:hypothetical protein
LQNLPALPFRKVVRGFLEIPDALWSGENMHREEVPGDRGYRYQPKFSSFPDLTIEQIAQLSGRGTKAP